MMQDVWLYTLRAALGGSSKHTQVQVSDLAAKLHQHARLSVCTLGPR